MVNTDNTRHHQNALIGIVVTCVLGHVTCNVLLALEQEKGNFPTRAEVKTYDLSASLVPLKEKISKLYTSDGDFLYRLFPGEPVIGVPSKDQNFVMRKLKGLPADVFYTCKSLGGQFPDVKAEQLDAAHELLSLNGVDKQLVDLYYEHNSYRFKSTGRPVPFGGAIGTGVVVGQAQSVYDLTLNGYLVYSVEDKIVDKVVVDRSINSLCCFRLGYSFKQLNELSTRVGKIIKEIYSFCQDVQVNFFEFGRKKNEITGSESVRIFGVDLILEFMEKLLSLKTELSFESLHEIEDTTKKIELISLDFQRALLGERLIKINDQNCKLLQINGHSAKAQCFLQEEFQMQIIKVLPLGSVPLYFSKYQFLKLNRSLEICLGLDGSFRYPIDTRCCEKLSSLSPFENVDGDIENYCPCSSLSKPLDMVYKDGFLLTTSNDKIVECKSGHSQELSTQDNPFLTTCGITSKDGYVESTELLPKLGDSATFSFVVEEDESYEMTDTDFLSLVIGIPAAVALAILLMCIKCRKCRTNVFGLCCIFDCSNSQEPDVEPSAPMNDLRGFLNERLPRA